MTRSDVTIAGLFFRGLAVGRRGTWHSTSRKGSEKWGTIGRCGANKYRGPFGFAQGRLFVGRPALPQGDKSEAALASGGNMASDGNSLRSRGFCKALGVLRLRATARRRAPLRMTTWSFTLRTWGPGAGRRWGLMVMDWSSPVVFFEPAPQDNASDTARTS
jgi:hypothetical protein